MCESCKFSASFPPRSTRPGKIEYTLNPSIKLIHPTPCLTRRSLRSPNRVGFQALSFMWMGWSKDDALKRKGNLKETQTRELELLGLLSAVLASIWARFVALTPEELEGKW